MTIVSKKIFLAQYGSKAHLTHLMKYPDWSVRSRVASNPSASKEHLDHLMKDSKDQVRNYARIRTDHLDQQR